MGCGVNGTRRKLRIKASREGKISKKDFVIRKYTTFADDYLIGKQVGSGITWLS